MTQNNANNRVVNELLKPLKKRSGAMIGWGIFCIVLGTIGLFAPIAFSVGVTTLSAQCFWFRCHRLSPSSGKQKAGVQEPPLLSLPF